MINFWCVCVGEKYSLHDISVLAAMIERNCREKYTFNCLCDERTLNKYKHFGLHYRGEKRVAENFICLDNPYPGWWSKILVHRYIATNEINIYLDLDVVIVADLEPLFQFAKSDESPLCMSRNWAKSGHGGYQSSVMCMSGFTRGITEAFKLERVEKTASGTPGCMNHGYYVDDDGERLWGDQEYLTKHYSGLISPIDDWLVVSYKYHCRVKGVPPKKAIVVAFHGEPKPHNVVDNWVREARVINLVR